MSETATYGGIRDKREFNDTLNDIETFVPMSEGSLETIYHETGFAIEPITLDDGVTVDGLTCACYLYAANLGGENGQAIIIRKLIDGQRIYGYVSREELLEVGITDFTVISTANSAVDEWLLVNTKTVGPTEVTFTTISAKIRSLISKSNAKTGVNNADLTTAVDKLIAGYGTGGGECSGEHVIEVSELPTEDIDTNAIYKRTIESAFSAVIILNGDTPMDLGSLYESLIEGSTCLYYDVPTIPTKNIQAVDTTNFTLPFYFVQDENDIFLYGDLKGTGTNSWGTFSEFFGDNELTFGGVITDMSEATDETKYYALGGGTVTRYYKYRDPKLVDVILFTTTASSLGPETSGLYYASTKPTTDIKVSDLANGGVYIYYIEDEHDLFVYGDVDGTGINNWYSISRLWTSSPYTFQGTITDSTEATETGYYAVITGGSLEKLIFESETIVVEVEKESYVPLFSESEWASGTYTIASSNTVIDYYYKSGRTDPKTISCVKTVGDNTSSNVVEFFYYSLLAVISAGGSWHYNYNGSLVIDLTEEDESIGLGDEYGGCFPVIIVKAVVNGANTPKCQLLSGDTMNNQLITYYKVNGWMGQIVQWMAYEYDSMIKVQMSGSLPHNTNTVISEDGVHSVVSDASVTVKTIVEVDSEDKLPSNALDGIIAIVR